MARLPRGDLVVVDSMNHCFWRVHNAERAFETPGARERYLELIAQYKARFGMKIMSYCLMGTHPHVATRCSLGQKAFSNFWKAVNQRFARWYNRAVGRRGQVVMERLRSPR